MRGRSVGIVGLGLIGGSLARDLAAQGARVLGYDTRRDTIEAALAEGVVEGALSMRAAPGAETPLDVLILATDVTSSIDWLRQLPPALRQSALITDVGSTKRGILVVAERAGLGSRFVGGHPLTGDHTSGWDGSRRGLFEGAPVYLCPTGTSAAGAVELARQLWTATGAVPALMSAAEHDQRLARTSHLPQVLASALANVLAQAGLGSADLGPGGRDMTRLAASSTDMWTAIALQNGDLIADALREVQQQIEALASATAAGDEARIRSFFDRAHRWSVTGSTASAGAEQRGI